MAADRRAPPRGRTGKCTGEPGRYPVNVPAEGPALFAAGSAEAHAEARVKNQGDVLDDHFWTRTLNVVLKP